MAGPSYIADDESQIRKVELDGLTALFHVPSGMTHIVAPPAPQILEALAGNPADLRPRDPEADTLDELINAPL